MIKINLSEGNVKFLQEVMGFTPVAVYDMTLPGCSTPVVSPTEFAVWAGNRLTGGYSFHSGLGVLAFEHDQDAVMFILDFSERLP
jgi:hypothetical protein